jgi:hypothetical protein
MEYRTPLDTEEYMFDININDRFGKTVPSSPGVDVLEKLVWFYGALFILPLFITAWCK